MKFIFQFSACQQVKMGEESQCGLPDEFCFMNLKKGAKVIGFLCLLLSIVSSILLLFYLFSDVDEITKEIAGNDMHTKEKLDPHTACKFINRFY